MESQRFDRIVSSLAETGNRRRVLGVLAASVGIGSASLLRLDTVEGKKKKKTELCLNGQSVMAAKKKKKKLLKQGATVGACPTSPPPSPPPPPPTKGRLQDCTPGVDICPAGLACKPPTSRSECNSTVDGHDNWCCIPVDGPCTRNCDCCEDAPGSARGYFCDMVNGDNGFCRRDG